MLGATNVALETPFAAADAGGRRVTGRSGMMLPGQELSPGSAPRLKAGRPMRPDR
jgi:hypothetical protein